MNNLHTTVVRTLLQLCDDYDQEFAARLGEWMERAGTTQELCDELTAMTQLYDARIQEILTLRHTYEADRITPLPSADNQSEEAQPDQ